MTNKNIIELTHQKFENIIQQFGYGFNFGINDLELDNNKEAIWCKWSSGGVSGGSCWESSNPKRYEGDKEPEFFILDQYLSSNYPNLSFLKYKELNNHIKYSYNTEYEYYGNSTDWCTKWILIEDIKKCLDEN